MYRKYTYMCGTRVPVLPVHMYVPCTQEIKEKINKKKIKN